MTRLILCIVLVTLAAVPSLGAQSPVTPPRRYTQGDSLRLPVLPILLSVVYAEVARRAGVRISGVGLPGHFVVGHFGTLPPLLLDPFNSGTSIDALSPPR